MLNWYWIDEDTCVFTVNGNEVCCCSDADFDKTHDWLIDIDNIDAEQSTICERRWCRWSDTVVTPK